MLGRRGGGIHGCSRASSRIGELLQFFEWFRRRQVDVGALNRDVIRRHLTWSIRTAGNVPLRMAFVAFWSWVCKLEIGYGRNVHTILMKQEVLVAPTSQSSYIQLTAQISHVVLQLFNSLWMWKFLLYYTLIGPGLFSTNMRTPGTLAKMFASHTMHTHTHMHRRTRICMYQHV